MERLVQVGLQEWTTGQVLVLARAEKQKKDIPFPLSRFFSFFFLR